MNLGDFLSKNAAAGSNEISYQCTAQRSNNRNPSVTPIGAAFASNRQDCMGNARTKVTGGVHGITRGATQGKAKSQNQDTYEVGAIARNERAKRYHRESVR